MLCCMAVFVPLAALLAALRSWLAASSLSFRSALVDTVFPSF